MDILIFSGQSNMQGQTESCPPCEPVAGALEYRYLSDRLVPVSHPVGEDIEDGLLLGAHEGNGSLIPDFCRTYIQATGHEVIAVHAARGSTVVADWMPDTDRYALLVRKVRGALAHCPEPPEHIYFLWLQGESDAIYSTAQDTYEASLCTLRAALCRDLGVDAFGIIRVGKFVRDERDLAIIRAQEALCQTDEFCLLTRITGVCTEQAAYLNPYVGGHYGNAGMALIGERAAINLARICLGREPILEDEPYEELRT